MNKLQDHRLKRKLSTSNVISTSVLLVPSLVLAAIVIFIPTFYIFIKSFCNWTPNYSSPFVGFDNYIEVLKSKSFQTVIKNQFFLLLGLPLWVFVPLFLSYLLYEDIKWPALWRTIFFLPSVLSPALIGIQFRTILGYDGVLNTWLRAMHLDFLAVDWLASPHLVKPIIILLILWSCIGTGVILLSSSMTSIPSSIFDQAKIDGVGWWQRLFYIVIPMIKKSISLWVSMQILSLFLFMFSWIYALTSGGPGLASTTIDYLIYQEVFRFGFFPTAAAMSMLLILILAILFVIQGFVSRFFGEKEA